MGCPDCGAAGAVFVYASGTDMRSSGAEWFYSATLLLPVAPSSGVTGGGLDGGGDQFGISVAMSGDGLAVGSANGVLYWYSHNTTSAGAGAGGLGIGGTWSNGTILETMPGAPSLPTTFLLDRLALSGQLLAASSSKMPYGLVLLFVPVNATDLSQGWMNVQVLEVGCSVLPPPPCTPSRAFTHMHTCTYTPQCTRLRPHSHPAT